MPREKTGNEDLLEKGNLARWLGIPQGEEEGRPFQKEENIVIHGDGAEFGLTRVLTVGMGADGQKSHLQKESGHSGLGLYPKEFDFFYLLCQEILPEDSNRGIMVIGLRMFKQQCGGFKWELLEAVRAESWNISSQGGKETKVNVLRRS